MESQQTSSKSDSESLPQFQKIQDGVIHLQSFLSQDEQIALLKSIRTAGTNYKQTRARNPNSNFMKLLAFNCHKDKFTIPFEFKDYSARATYAAHLAHNKTIIPSSYVGDYITSFEYSAKEGKLTGHVDKVLGWVVLFSLGCTAIFYIKGPQMAQKKVINFESGDVLVFNGGTEYKIHHGIDEIVSDTCPPYLDLADSRISLQMRQTERNDNYRAKNYY